MKHLLLLTALFALVFSCGDNKANNPVTPDPPKNQDARLYGTWAYGDRYGTDILLTFYRDSITYTEYRTGQPITSFRQNNWYTINDTLRVEGKFYYEGGRYDIVYIGHIYEIKNEDTLTIFYEPDTYCKYCDIPLLRQP